MSEAVDRGIRNVEAEIKAIKRNYRNSLLDAAKAAFEEAMSAFDDLGESLLDREEIIDRIRAKAKEAWSE